MEGDEVHDMSHDDVLKLIESIKLIKFVMGAHGWAGIQFLIPYQSEGRISREIPFRPSESI